MSFVIRLLMIILLLFLVEFYFTRKTVRAVKRIFPDISKKKIKRTTLTGLIILNLFPLLLISAWAYAYIAQTENIRQPENFFYEYFVLYPFWIGITIIIQSIVLLIPLDLIKLIIYVPFKKFRDKLKTIHAWVVFVLVSVISLYVPVRIIYDLNTISTRTAEYTKENLPAVLDGYRITFIADVQADQFTKYSKLHNYIEKVNATNPDLVLIAGDIVTGNPDYISLAAEYLGKIKARYGVYSCVGDHDNWAYRNDYERSLREITEALAKVNIKMIDNGKVNIAVDSANIGITFITNTYVERIPDNLLDSLSNHSKHYDLKIFLTHQPREYLLDKAV
ncbi:MAG: hypothetical protein A2V66_17275, partial [Ignavibacteria bacterium RBG_13_36_8]